ncbi:MAG TPA: (Fe-S)-binding protein, partial [Candidatus Marinimicrobia bacterium]|nr:(Fe-S)-binding protein [Candidatus Neomarinimicrobiota bacterium]
MNSTTFLYSLLSMGGIGLFFSILIAVANKKLHVEEDPKISLIAECLPGANCGSCGYAGCNNFAEALAGGKSQISNCPVCSPSAREEIARILGVSVEIGERQ